MRNAVIRKKALAEQAMLRKFISTPTRIMLGTDHFDGVDWFKMSQARIWGGAL